MSSVPLSCPNCGADVSAGQEFCPQCGLRLAAANRRSKAMRVTAIILFVVIGIPAGVMGGCLLLIGGLNTGVSVLGLLGLLLAVALVVFLAYSMRKKE